MIDRHSGAAVSRAAPGVAVAVATAASVGLYGYAFGLHNHSIQIPFLRWLKDPSLFPGDRCVEAMRGYFSFFWPAMAWLTHWLPLEVTFFVGHVLTVAATYAAVFAIARRTFPVERRAAYLAVWLVLWGKSVVGEESLHWFYLGHTPVATAIGLWVIWLATAGRWVTGFALAGVVFNVHAMQSAYLLLMLAFALGAEWGSAGKRVALAAAAYALAAAPGLWWMIRSQALSAPADLDLLLRAYFPAHFFASSFKGEHLVGLIVMAALLATCWIGLNRTPPVGRLCRMCAAILIMWLVGGVSDEWWPNAFVLKLHVFRASSYFCYLVLILFAGYLAAVWRRHAMGRLPPVAVLAVTLALAVAGSSRWWAVACLLPFLWSLGRGRSASLLAAFAAGTFFIVLRRFGLLGGVEEMPIVHDEQVFWPLLVALAAAIAAPLLRSGLRHVATTVTLIGLAWLVAVSQASRVAEQHQSFRTQQSWFAVQRWAREHSDPAELFLTPPDCEGFRVFSERPVVGEWKDGAAVLWDASYADYWREWYERVGGRFSRRPAGTIQERLARSWFALGQDGIEAVARSYGARYIVLRRPELLEQLAGVRLDWHGPTLFENDRFYVVSASPSAN